MKPTRKPTRKKQRKIIVEIATSADGYIARPNGAVDWLDRPSPKGNYGMGEFFKTIDTILWGRKTYSKGIEMGMKSGDFGPKVKNYLFSRNPDGVLLPEFEYARGPIKAFAQNLRQQGGKDIWMMGGGELIASFLDEGEIDEFSIHVIPVFIGEGIRLIAPRHRTVPLKLLSTKKFSDGVVHLNYSVVSRGVS
ncbi:MAG TPA: dihydrofolate reductase family protein [Candidatus Solibacter sp.]|nr:dihydrofolate reductase family protein [Candidatus Solibacter sp.]